jgi:hypothetical protein
MTKADQFDLAKIRLDPTDPVHATAKPTRKRKDPSKWERRYTQFPYAWEERLRDCKAAGSTYRAQRRSAHSLVKRCAGRSGC